MTAPPPRPADDDTAARPLYAQVLHTLRQEIVQGVFPVGTRLPPEDELCARFGVSRHTVREALRRLREDGLVSSRQGAGTTVSRTGASPAYVPEISTISDLIAFAAGTRYEVESTGMVTCDDALAARIGSQPGQSWLRIAGLRSEAGGGAPICWVEAYVATEYAGIGRLLERHPGPIFELIESLYGESVAQVQQELTAPPAEAAIAAALGVAEGATVIELKRVYRLSSGPVCQVAFNIHPAPRFRMTITLNRARA